MNKVLLKAVTKKIGSGATPSGGQNSYHASGISFIRSQNVHDFEFSMDGLAFIDERQAKELNNVNVIEGDILLNITGDSIARVCMVPSNVLPARVNQHVSIIRSNENIDSNYLLCYLMNLKPYLLKICGVGGTRNALTKEVIQKLEIELPNLRNQRNIGLIISSINSKIELNNRINAELEAMAKTLYDYWFVQFDFPTSAEYAAAAGKPDKHGKPYKTSGGKMVWDEKLKREVPEGWEVEKLHEISSLLVRGISPKYIENEGVIVLNQKCIRNKSIDFSFARRHDNLSKKIESKLIQVGDILVNSTGVGTLGRLALVKKLDEELVTVDSHVTIVRIDEKMAHRFYTGFSLTEKQSEIEGFGVGSTGQTELSREELGNVLIILPNDTLQMSFESFLIPIIQRIANNEKENQTLSSLRDWLLPMLMNGQVKVG